MHMYAAFSTAVTSCTIFPGYETSWSAFKSGHYLVLTVCVAKLNTEEKSCIAFGNENKTASILPKFCSKLLCETN